ncbi:LOW QUALITY PROTEIN: craniofacial development protein 2-like [Thunnus albacares]|uniref:LOW QUALITY PROTEIN: craniofacial development protein 2-like n=1 Tax=Thunnus albacares TaxID=8236 RepID=UPI001CF6DE3E|nr:LOW QUALITY PROTEIN: craniofacial development protein 2-like [Thunnus albacares]
MMTTKARKAMTAWKPISSRLISATFQTKNRRVKHIIQCYAPTNDAGEEVKARNYDSLNHLLGSNGARDLTILMGDFNAKIGGQNDGYEVVMGKHGVGDMNENREMFAETCANNNLVTGGSVFPHKTIHKTTWVSPDHVAENQIDHICICKKFRRSMEDVRSRRGADAASDHHLLVG